MTEPLTYDDIKRIAEENNVPFASALAVATHLPEDEVDTMHRAVTAPQEATDAEE